MLSFVVKKAKKYRAFKIQRCWYHTGRMYTKLGSNDSYLITCWFLPVYKFTFTKISIHISFHWHHIWKIDMIVSPNGHNKRASYKHLFEHWSIICYLYLQPSDISSGLYLVNGKPIAQFVVKHLILYVFYANIPENWSIACHKTLYWNVNELNERKDRQTDRQTNRPNDIGLTIDRLIRHV